MDAKARDALVIFQITKRMPDIPHLDGVLSAQKNPYNNTEMTLVYMKAFSLVEYLIERYGIWELLEVVKAFDSADSTDRLFRDQFKCGTAEIEESWLKWIERRKI